MLARTNFGSESMTDFEINPDKKLVSRNNVANYKDHAATTQGSADVYVSDPKKMGTAKKNTPSNILLYR